MLLTGVDYERIALSLSLITLVLVICFGVGLRMLRERQKPEIDRLHRDLRDVKHEVNNLVTGAQGLPIMHRRLEEAERASTRLASEMGGVRDGISRLERMVEMLVSHQVSAEGKGEASPRTDGGGG